MSKQPTNAEIIAAFEEFVPPPAIVAAMEDLIRNNPQASREDFKKIKAAQDMLKRLRGMK